MVKALSWLLFANKLNDDLTKFRTSDDLLKEYNMLEGLDKTFQEDIKLEQTKNLFGFNE